MRPATVLVIDDDPDVLLSVQDALAFYGYQVLSSPDGREGLEKARAFRPDLIILDVKLPDIDGYEVCRRLRADPGTRSIPIIMFTAMSGADDRAQAFKMGADQYLLKDLDEMSKPFNKEELRARIEGLLQRARREPPPPPRPPDALLTITYGSDGRVLIESRGVEVFAGEGGRLDLDREMIRREMDNVGRFMLENRQWRFEVKRIGQSLYRQLFDAMPILTGRYNAILARVKRRDLHIIFKGEREALGIPFETLFDGQDYLVLQHQLYRFVMGVPPITSALPLADWLARLREKGEPLRLLLIAARPRSPGLAVDEEIQAIRQIVIKEAPRIGLRVQVDTLPSERATYTAVLTALEQGGYHLIHFAGHGWYEAGRPEQSGILVGREPDPRKHVHPLPTYTLVDLLRDSEVQFVYLSSCRGAQSGPALHLLDNEYLGLIDGLIQAGVPAVLGFRWPVHDSGAQAFARSFYTALFQSYAPSPSRVLLEARRQIARTRRDDPTWLSPVLISQVP